jgi:hypothetical protein
MAALDVAFDEAAHRLARSMTGRWRSRRRVRQGHQVPAHRNSPLVTSVSCSRKSSDATDE